MQRSVPIRPGLVNAGLDDKLLKWFVFEPGDLKQKNVFKKNMQDSVLRELRLEIQKWLLIFNNEQCSQNSQIT